MFTCENCVQSTKLTTLRKWVIHQLKMVWLLTQVVLVFTKIKTQVGWLTRYVNYETFTFKLITGWYRLLGGGAVCLVKKKSCYAGKCYFVDRLWSCSRQRIYCVHEMVSSCQHIFVSKHFY